MNGRETVAIPAHPLSAIDVFSRQPETESDPITQRLLDFPRDLIPEPIGYAPERLKWSPAAMEIRLRLKTHGLTPRSLHDLFTDRSLPTIIRSQDGTAGEESTLAIRDFLRQNFPVLELDCPEEESR